MKPVVQALLLAERVYTDKTSDKKIISGTFNRITLNRKGKTEGSTAHPTVPGKSIIKGPIIDAGTPWVYLSITDVVPQIDLTLQIANVSNNQVCFEFSIHVESKDRLQTMEIALPLIPLTMLVQEPGTYSMDLVCEGEIIGSHRLLVEDVTPKEEGS